MTQAVKSPVIINKYGKLLISPEEYEKFNQFEDMYWAMQARNASKSDFLSEEESKDFLDKMLKNRYDYNLIFLVGLLPL